VAALVGLLVRRFYYRSIVLGTALSRPLVMIAEWMKRYRQRPRQRYGSKSVSYDDELGSFLGLSAHAWNRMPGRRWNSRSSFGTPGAVGRLAAGVLHEINNPLGGMPTAIDTLKSHGESNNHEFGHSNCQDRSPDQRGLSQIKETVSALLSRRA